MKMFTTDEEAVSPVIGVILMVAIVVILAAVIAAFVFGMAGGTGTAKNIGMTVTVNETDWGTITLQGGADLPQVTKMEWSLDGGTYEDVNQTATTGSAVTATDFKVGNVLSFGDGDVAIRGHRVLIKAAFTDGSEQIVFDRRY